VILPPLVFPGPTIGNVDSILTTSIEGNMHRFILKLKYLRRNKTVHAIGKQSFSSQSHSL